MSSCSDDAKSGVAVTESLPILGIPVTLFDSYQDAARLIHESLNSNRRTVCLAINPAKIYHANRDANLKRVLHEAQVHICDGAGVAVAAMILHRRRIRRCTGVELFRRLVAIGAQEQWKIFLLGASPESNAGARSRLLREHPGVRIVGSRDGYFKDSNEVVAAINESGADMLFVAMGSPRQELWIDEHLPKLHVRFCMGVGGSFDVLSGAARRAPVICQKTGTEWLYRVLLQPSRLPRVVTNGLFVLDVLKAAFAGHERQLITSG